MRWFGLFLSTGLLLTSGFLAADVGDGRALIAVLCAGVGGSIIVLVAEAQ